MTDELITFLRARLDELEASAPSGHFVYDIESVIQRCPAARDPERCGDLQYGEENCDCGLTARRAYALADVAAKRQIIELVIGAYAGYAVLPLLALPFAGHPDCREEWRP